MSPEPGSPHAADPQSTLVRLVRDHQGKLFAYAYRLTGQTADAEDLVQQTFLVAQQRLDQVREPAKIRGWLFAVLRSQFFKLCRRRFPTLAADVEEIESEMHRVAPPPAGEKIDRQRLEQAVHELPDEFRLVVMMYYMEQISYKEIAAELGIPIGTVMSRLSRAKRHLRRRLQAEGTESAGREDGHFFTDGGAVGAGGGNSLGRGGR